MPSGCGRCSAPCTAERAAHAGGAKGRGPRRALFDAGGGLQRAPRGRRGRSVRVRDAEAQRGAGGMPDGRVRAERAPRRRPVLRRGRSAGQGRRGGGGRRPRRGEPRPADAGDGGRRAGAGPSTPGTDGHTPPALPVVRSWVAGGGSAAARPSDGVVLLPLGGASQPIRLRIRGSPMRSRWGQGGVDNPRRGRVNQRRKNPSAAPAAMGNSGARTTETKSGRATRSGLWMGCGWRKSGLARIGERSDRAGRARGRRARQRPEPAARRAGASGPRPRRTQRPPAATRRSRRGGGHQAPRPGPGTATRGRTRSRCRRRRSRTRGSRWRPRGSCRRGRCGRCSRP